MCTYIVHILLKQNLLSARAKWNRCESIEALKYHVDDEFSSVIVPLVTQRLIEDVIKYFKSDPWRNLVRLVKEPDVIHLHLYVETCIHPYSLEKLVVGALMKNGLELERRIDHIYPLDVPPNDHYSLHVIQPAGCRAHFGIAPRFSADATLLPMRGHEGKELMPFRDEDTNDFLRQFNFRKVGKREEEEISKYFESEHWKGLYEIVMAKDYGHMHINVETSVHPEVLAKFATRALETGMIGWPSVRMAYPGSRAWKVQHAKSLYIINKADGKKYGIIKFLLSHPEIVFDMGWIFNSNVLVRPSTKPIQRWPGSPQYEIGPPIKGLEEFIRDRIRENACILLDERDTDKIVDAI